MKVKELLHAIYFRFAGETGVDAVGLLLAFQDPADLYGGEFSFLIAETETHRGDLAVSVGAGDHLYRDINAKNTFHVYQLLFL